MGKKVLKVKDIERLENTSMASALVPGANELELAPELAEVSVCCVGSVCSINGNCCTGCSAGTCQYTCDLNTGCATGTAPPPPPCLPLTCFPWTGCQPGTCGPCSYQTTTH